MKAASRAIPRGLTRTQAASFGVNTGATGLLAAQNLVVLLLLSRREVGLLGIASGIGALALIAQYFGVGAATLKEVAVADSPAAAFEAFIGGLVLRLVLSLPIAGAFAASSGLIASSLYGYPELTTPLIIVAGTIVLYGVSDVLGYTLQGLQLWRRFFISKALGATLQFPVVVAFTAIWGLQGYFAGFGVAAAVATVVAAVALVPVFGIRHRLPNTSVLRATVRGMLGLSVSAYAAKIFQVLVLQAPILAAGYWYSATTTGDVKFALTIATLVLSVSGAVNTINISVFSRDFAAGGTGFWQRARTQIMTFAVLTGVVAATAGLLAPDIVRLVAHGQYSGAVDITVLAISGAALHGLIGVIVSTVHVPAGAHLWFVALFLVPAAITSLASVTIAASGGAIGLLGLAILVGGVCGLALAFFDLTRRSVSVLGAAPILAVSVLVASLPLVGISSLARYALAAGTVLVGVGLVRHRGAAIAGT